MSRIFIKAWTAMALCAVLCSQAWAAASPDDTRLASATGSITDSTGAKWTLSGGYIYVNGTRDAHSANVICLAYEGGRMWQENASHTWYVKTKPSDTWAPSGGTQNSPLPPLSATVASGAMKIRADPMTTIGITALGPNGTYPGSITAATDGYGNVSVPTSSLFGHYTYLVSEFRNPTLLTRSTDTAMFSAEAYYQGSYKACCTDDYEADLKHTYGAEVRELDWTALAPLRQKYPVAFSLFAESLGGGEALILNNGSSGTGGDSYYVVRSKKIAGANGATSFDLYLTTDFPIFSTRVAFSNHGPSAYAFNTVASVTVVVP